MPFDSRDFRLSGPALPEPFVRLQLEEILKKQKLLSSTKDLQKEWSRYRNHLGTLREIGGSRRVKNHVLDPLVDLLGYASIKAAGEVETREGLEDGGFVMQSADGKSVLRCWTAGVNTDLDAPTRRGRAFRFSLQNIALRVLGKQGERAGLVTDGDELRLLIVNPSGRESFISFDLTRGGWRGASTVPDSFRLFCALAKPDGIDFLPELTEKARLAQAEVTKTLRDQARNAITDFLQNVLSHPDNVGQVQSFPIRCGRNGAAAEIPDTAALAAELWREGLIIVYRLLFILKLESSPDPSRSFSFASTSLWRNTYSPNTALASWVDMVLAERKETGGLLEDGLRALFRLFVRGLRSSELNVSPLGGQLFGPDTTPLLDSLNWGEQAVALLLQHLLWTPEDKKKKRPRMRVHYGYLDVEDLGRVYEALLEREPGIATERMCRLKRDKLEVVVTWEQGEPYRTSEKKSKVEWVEEIPAGRFYLRVGLGRKSSGSYYTPDAFVKFLVQETLGPLSEERSPLSDPQPAALLTIKALDPAMGSGHFLVEACRFLGERLYEACRRCDELAIALNAAADAKEAGKRIEDQAILKELDAHLLKLAPAELRARADMLYKRVQVLPDPNDELLQYLPSRSTEGGESSGVSLWKARALCRRLVAVHCLYGVDKNPLAVELAKLVLWLESYAEGYPLTFLDHRLVQGDSITGPFFTHLTTHPVGGENLLSANLQTALETYVGDALAEVRALEASIGKDVADLEQKQLAEQRLRAKLAPLNALADAWSGGVMLGRDYEGDIDFAYDEAAQAVGGRFRLGPAYDPLMDLRKINPTLDAMVRAGSEGVSYDLRFPEVFWRTGDVRDRTGFDVVLGNPPWEGIDTSYKEFFASYDFSVLEKDNKQVEVVATRLLQDPEISKSYQAYERVVTDIKRISSRLYEQINQSGESISGATSDLYQCFGERSFVLLGSTGLMGAVFPFSIHANEGAAGLRRMMLYPTSLKACFSFENKGQKFFEIDSRYKFALIVIQRGKTDSSFECGFYMHNAGLLFSDWRLNEALLYNLDFLQGTTGPALNFLELRERSSVPIALTYYKTSKQSLGLFKSRENILPGEELHATRERYRTSLLNCNDNDPRLYSFLGNLLKNGKLLVLKGEDFHQYTDLWEQCSSIYTSALQLQGKESRLRASCYYRMVFRRQASSTNERTFISALSQPGTLYFNSAPVESKPWARPTARVLALVAIVNTFSFDWIIRQLVTSNLTNNFIDAAPLPRAENAEAFLVHVCLRLSCNHSGYEPLWREQLCYIPELADTWREEREPFTWPVLEGDDARWQIRAAIDAVVAQAYGLNREQYEHILASFSHKSYPNAPARCLQMWDELHELGLEAFTKKHDPYWDIPLNESLAKPVINLPGIVDLADDAEGPGNEKNEEKAALDLEVFSYSPPLSKVVDKRGAPRPLLETEDLFD